MTLLIEESLQNSGIQLESNRVAGLNRGHLSEQMMLFPSYGQSESRLKGAQIIYFFWIPSSETPSLHQNHPEKEQKLFSLTGLRDGDKQAGEYLWNSTISNLPKELRLSMARPIGNRVMP